jgi:hypothetical protein
MLRFIVALAFVALVSAEDLEPRFGFPSTDTSTNSIALTFNQTSLNNALLFGAAFLLVTVIVLPILGITIFGGAFDVFGLGDAFRRRDRNAYSQEYDASADYYAQYAQQRSLSLLDPILSALKSAYERYEESQS